MSVGYGAVSFSLTRSIPAARVTGAADPTGLQLEQQGRGSGHQTKSQLPCFTAALRAHLSRFRAPPLRPSIRALRNPSTVHGDELRQFLIERGTIPVIPNNPTRKRFHPFDAETYKLRNIVERALCRRKDWRRIATSYDKLAANFSAAVAIAATIIWWT